MYKTSSLTKYAKARPVYAVYKNVKTRIIILCSTIQLKIYTKGWRPTQITQNLYIFFRSLKQTLIDVVYYKEDEFVYPLIQKTYCRLFSMNQSQKLYSLAAF